jgi:hypothetical protein
LNSTSVSVPAEADRHKAGVRLQNATNAIKKTAMMRQGKGPSVLICVQLRVRVSGRTIR